MPSARAMADYDPYFQGSTRKILSLIKTLPDKDTFNNAVRRIIDDGASDVRKRRRFNKHPRRIASMPPRADIPDRDDPFVVLKKPSASMLTDSSDEYCDVTVRRETIREYDEIEIAEHVLQKIVLTDDDDEEEEDGKLKFRETGKLVKDRVNSVRKLGKKAAPLKTAIKQKVEVEDKPKEIPKLYIDRKLRGVIEKSVQTLHDIESMLNFGLGDSCDPNDDEERRKKRAAEFASRFSRIHLYQLNRHVSDLEDMVRPQNGKSAARPNVFTLNQKFHTANQTVHQGLQSYQKNFSVAIVPGAPEKLTDFLKVVNSMCDLYRDYSTKHPTGEEETYDELIKSLEDRCKILTGRIGDALSMRKPSGMRGSQSDVSLQERRSALAKRPKSDKQKKLSMYHNSNVPIRGDVYWKKAIATLSQKKFDVPSRYKTATFKHRPPPSPTPPPEEEKAAFTPQKIATKSDAKKTGGCRHRAKKIINDIDNVSTLVQVQNERDAGAVAQSQTMRSLAQEFFNKVSKGNETMTQEQYECILDHFIMMVNNDACDSTNIPVRHIHADRGDAANLEHSAQRALEEKLGNSIENMSFEEFVEQFMSCVNADVKKNEREGEKIICEKEDEAVPIRKKQSITITGAKNAPLICIKEDTTSEDEKPPVVETNEDVKVVKTKESQSALVYKEVPVSSDFGRSISKLTRIQRTDLQQVEMLPKETVVKIIEYKLQFHKQTKNNCMYKKSGNMSPLNLLERISDKLLDELLMSVTRDIQVEEILQKVYIQEFK